MIIYEKDIKAIAMKNYAITHPSPNCKGRLINRRWSVGMHE